MRGHIDPQCHIPMPFMLPMLPMSPRVALESGILLIVLIQYYKVKEGH